MRIPKVLFLCTGNSCSSQMAEGWARVLAPDRFEAFSAGIYPCFVHPLAIKVMREAGVDISGQYSKHVEELDGIPFDYIVTLCGHADENCPASPLHGKRVHRPFDDPVFARGTETEVLGAFRSVRDRIRRLGFKMPSERRRSVRDLVFLHQRVAAAMGEDKQVNMRVLRRLARECEERDCRIEDLIDLFGADCSSMKESKRHLVAEQHTALVTALGQMREEDLRPRLPAGIGNAIMERFGLPAGPEVGNLLQRLDEWLIECKIDPSDSGRVHAAQVGNRRVR